MQTKPKIRKTTTSLGLRFIFVFLSLLFRFFSSSHSNLQTGKNRDTFQEPFCDLIRVRSSMDSDESSSAPPAGFTRHSQFIRESQRTIMFLMVATLVLCVVWIKVSSESAAALENDRLQSARLQSLFRQYWPGSTANRSEPPTPTPVAETPIIPTVVMDEPVSARNQTSPPPEPPAAPIPQDTWFHEAAAAPDDWPLCSPVGWKHLQAARMNSSMYRNTRAWVFCHMPKTGGMTMRNMLTRWARATGKTQNRAQRVSALNKNYDTPRCGPGQCQGILGTQSWPQLQRLFRGPFRGYHVPRTASQNESDVGRVPVNRLPTLLTMLRDPVERSYSAYHYVLRESNKPIHPLYKRHSLKTLLERGLFYNDIGLGRNAYTRVLSDFLPDQAKQCRLQWKKHTGQWSDRLEGPEYWDCLLRIAKRVLSQYMHLVCVTERYADCVTLVAAELFPDWFPEDYGQIPHRNAAAKKHASRSPEVDRLLREANAQDMELYGYARALFDCRWKYHLQLIGDQQGFWGWGNNDHGQLGLANGATTTTTTTTSSLTLQQPTALQDPLASQPLIQLGGGGGIWDWQARNPSVCGSFSLALHANGTLYSTGWNQWGLLGRNTKSQNDPRFAPVPIGDQTSPQAVVQFAAGHRHVVVVTVPRLTASQRFASTSNLYAWGMNGYGQLGLSRPRNDRDPRPRAVFPIPTPEAVESGTDHNHAVVQVAAGGRHSLALTFSGKVYAWGLNDAGMLGIGQSTTHVIRPTLVRVLPANQTFAAICAATRHSMALSRRNGELWEWGWTAKCARHQMRLCKKFYARAVRLPYGAGQPVSIECKGGANFALDAQGQLYAWGTNAVSELGLGHPADAGMYIDQPQLIQHLPPIQAVVTSYDYTPGFHGGATLALSSEGSAKTQLWGWGPLGPLSSTVILDDHQDRSPSLRNSHRHSKDRKPMSAHRAREWCKKHNDGHMKVQLDRCVSQLWTRVFPRPVRLQIPHEIDPRYSVQVAMVNRASVLLSGRQVQ